MATRTGRPLTRERIVDVAIALADRQGIGALSMRKLSAKLGYEPMSLYNHVAGKDDLLDAMVDRVAGEFGEAPPDAGWKEAIREIALSARAALSRHPWALELWTSRIPGPARLAHMDGLLRVLSTAGLAEHQVDLGFHAVLIHIHGFTQQELGFATGLARVAHGMRSFLDDGGAAAYPYVAAHMSYHDADDRATDDFTMVLDLLLDGLDRG